jgi:plasmid stabilization system protein ParE
MTTPSVSDEAQDDIAAIADWYISQDAPHVVAWFRTELAQTLARLAASPGLGTPGPHHTRTLPLHRFPVSLVYRWSDNDGIRVIAVSGQRRRPGHWQGRR